MTPGPAAVEVRGLRHTFGDTVAVDDLDLTVQPGEIFGLLGPNGAGKTTTIRVITTLLPPMAGSVTVFGLDVNGRKMAVRRLVGYVPQLLSADGALSGRENVALFARLFDVPRAQRRERTAAAIDAMGLSEAADRPASTYSGGMVRRLELAQALVSSPRLLILDEPTIGLDPVARSGVWERILDVRQQTGMTVLVTTHYMDEAEQYCDRVALMHRGRIRAMGTPGELIASLDGAGESLDDVFRSYTGDDLDSGGFRDVRAARRTARRLG
ncbi:ATP-binding cassette domain-containing protein [Planosporangium thailandense]|uniref:ATP-binding cassette domain-containing protein n=1 Tax=Planosporangium thailandense TaxID=765197 RepID=A0ABX0Y8Q8_9ACTN|nr:ATP-binding cassette domain-containing protein [Planosporangium thailandense]NJC73900.1 ATP-binding cassette domain-containing protein [Planosporangium thailandense]